MSQMDELIWKMFDSFHTDFPEDPIPEMERFSPMRFYREQHVFRMSDFASRIIELAKVTELPTGSILHLLDDAMYPLDHSDVPRIQDNIFLKKESFQKKFIYHMRELDLGGPIVLEDKYIYRPAGLPSIFMKFRSEYKSFFRYLNLLSEVPTNKECLVVINHNPLFRTRVLGRYRYFRKLQLILTSIMNTTHKLQNVGKQQFIQIPWGEDVFDRQMFIRTRSNTDPILVKRPESFQFIMMMHLVNFMWNDATNSVFRKLPPEDLQQLNLIIQLNDKYIFFNMQDLLRLNEKNRAHLRFCNQLNTLSVIGRVQQDASEEVKEKADTFFKKASEEAVPATETEPDVVSEPVVKEEFSPRVETVAPATETEPQEKADIAVDEKTETLIRHAAVAIPISVPAVPKTTVSIVIPSAHAAVKEASASGTKEIATIVSTNSTAIRNTHEHQDVHAKEYLHTLDTEAAAFINSRQELTPKEKTRFIAISQKYKNLELGGENLETILLHNTDMTLEDDIVDKNQVGDLPDPSGLKSSIANFDHVYMHKTFKKHLVGVATAFQKNGVFLTGIKEEKQVSEMNNVTQYSLRYEDVEGRQSTVRFRFPTVDAEGKVLIDGVKQVLKKQRIALPIVKISDTEISLASNQNKTRVVRNENKAHNYFSFIDSMVNSPKSSALIEFGSCQVNLPLSYEYSSLAERYKRISFSSNGDDYELYFDYNTRAIQFSGTADELQKLEKVYGAYFGENKKDWFFVNNQNAVQAVSKSGGEDFDYPYSSIFQILRLSLREGESFTKTLSEWVSIKILDKQLPIIFVLAYRFGLRNILDYMGLKYTVTERRNKTIVGESIPGQAAFEELYALLNPDFIIGQEAFGLTGVEKPISFPQEEIPTLMTQDTIVTTRVADDFDKFQLGDLVIAPWDDVYVVTDRKVFTDIDQHPFLDELTIGQRATLSKYSEYAVLTLTKQSEANISDNKKYIPNSDDIAIKFADRTIWFNRYPLAHSLVVAGLEAFDLSAYELSSFESKDVYFQLLQDKRFSTNYLKGIDSFFDLFIDNMTYSTLKMMHEPTTVKDLLLRCAVLLSTLDYRPPSSRLNFRIRGYEQFNAVLYNEMARQFAAYQTRRGKANTFSINPDAVFLRIIQNASMVPSESVNPLQDIKEMSYMTYAGIGGRTSDSFVVNDRKFDTADIGVISEATVDNQKVGINAQLSMDPGIANTMGVLDPKPMDQLQPANVLSAHALVFPFSTHDDAKRMNFISIQSTHMVPTKTVDMSRVRTGYERIIAHRVGRTFAGMANQDGKVTGIDEKARLIELTYTDGKVDIFSYGEQYTEFQGFHVTQDLVPVVKLGQKIKKGEVVTYNKGYFTRDPLTGQLDMSIGILANVALLENDTTLEDSTEISKRLSEKLTIRPTNSRIITLTKKSVIHQVRSVGEHVLNTDNLVVFEEEPVEGSDMFNVDDATMALLADMNRNKPTAKFNGKIVAMDAFYGCPISEMHPTLASVVRSAIDKKNRRNRLADKTDRAEDFPPSGIMPVGSKYKGVMFDAETVCLVFYIQEDVPHDKGDKLVFMNQLKCTCAGIFPQVITSESGIEIDAYFSADAIYRRCVMSPMLYGVLARIVEKIESDAVALYFEKK